MGEEAERIEITPRVMRVMGWGAIDHQNLATLLAYTSSLPYWEVEEDALLFAFSEERARVLGDIVATLAFPVKIVSIRWEDKKTDVSCLWVEDLAATKEEAGMAWDGAVASASREINHLIKGVVLATAMPVTQEERRMVAIFSLSKDLITLVGTTLDAYNFEVTKATGEMEFPEEYDPEEDKLYGISKEEFAIVKIPAKQGRKLLAAFGLGGGEVE